MFRNFQRIFSATLLACALATAVTAQGVIPRRYSATNVTFVPVPYSVTKVEVAKDLGSDLFRIWVPGFLAVATAPNEYFNNWPGGPNPASIYSPMKFQSMGAIRVQGLATPLILVSPGHLQGAAAVPVGSTLTWSVETRDSTGKKFTGHLIKNTLLRTR